MQIFFHLCAGIGYNVRRYVALVRQLADGGACFCTRGARQGYDGYYLSYRVGKNRDTGMESPDGTVRGSLCRQPQNDPLLVRRFSRHRSQ